MNLKNGKKFPGLTLQRRNENKFWWKLGSICFCFSLYVVWWRETVLSPLGWLRLQTRRSMWRMSSLFLSQLWVRVGSFIRFFWFLNWCWCRLFFRWFLVYLFFFQVIISFFFKEGKSKEIVTTCYVYVYSGFCVKEEKLSKCLDVVRWRK